MHREPHPFDARFGAFAAELEAFAGSRNLLIDKYYHDAPYWSFCFAHPLGGQAKLDLRIDEQGVVMLETVWWIDSYRQFTRSLKWGAKIAVRPESDEIVRALERGLSDVAGWRTGEWTQVADGYKPIWGRMSEAQFVAMTPRWPKPTL
jgi:hypothetical protein